MADTNVDPLEDHSEIFLTHAHVYRFSKRADWISLNTLAFYNRVYGEFTALASELRSVARGDADAKCCFPRTA